jgi:BASS family bile acid:Na+ symporter
VQSIDAVRLNFNPASLHALNAVLGFVMFGVALDLDVGDFRRVLDRPRPVLIGLFGHFVAGPAVAYALVRLLQPAPSVALGLMLVAACPAGNISNFLAHLAKGNTALSVSISSCSTVLAVVLTPLNLRFWAGQYGPTAALLRDVAVDPVEMFTTIFILLGIPLALGLWVGKRYPAFRHRARKPMKTLALVVFALFVLIAMAANWHAFTTVLGGVVIAVGAYNAAAYASGYGTAALFGLPERDRRAVAMEVGVQNSGLGMILAFTFFDGLGGMAITCAWWGIWQILTGLALGTWWSRRPTHAEPEAVPA